MFVKSAWAIILFALIPISIGEYGFSIITKILCVISLLPGMLLGKNGRLSENEVLIIYFLTFSIVVGGISAWMNDYSTFESYSVDVFIYIAIVMFMRVSCMPGQRPTLEAMQKVLRYSILINVLFIILMYFLGMPMFSLDYGNTRFNGALGPPGSAIFYLACFIYLAPISVVKKSLFDGLLCVFLLGLILITETRIVLVAICVYGVLLYLWVKDKSVKRFMALGVMLFFIMAAVYISDRLLYLGAEYASSADFVDNIDSSGRDYIWSMLWDAVINEMGIWGFGIGSASSFLIERSLTVQIATQPHNDYLKLIFNTGWLFGGGACFLVIYYFIKSLFIVWKQGVNIELWDFVFYGFCVCLAIVMITDNIIAYHFYTYPMFLCYALSKKN